MADPIHQAHWKNPEIANQYKKGEKWTGPPGRLLLKQAGLLDVSMKESLAILDNACGTGVITSLLHEMLDKDIIENMKLTCGDISPVMLDAVRQRIETNGWKAETRIADVQKTGLPDNAFDYVLTNFGLMLLPDGRAALKECFRILKPAGTNAFTTWQAIGWIPDAMAALSLIPDVPRVPEGETLSSRIGDGLPWHDPSWLETTMRECGFEDVKTQVMPNPRTVDNAEELVSALAPLLTGLFMKKFWNEEEMGKFGPQVKPKMMEYLNGKYGEGKPFTIEMVAVIASGRKPA